ncbi:MAG TPA: hypothetical protein VKD47_10155 [Miltoncostaeaceae bacterium]|nr:hypothetical protein [Miltoncostaeaceae bacterium]
MVLDTLTKHAGRLAGDVQHSLRRARLEGERRVLQRQHRAALEELGQRAYELVRAGKIDDALLGPELAAVEGKLMEIDAKSAEVEAVRAADEQAADAADVAFPMVPGNAGSTSPGAGWEAADRFFKHD